MGDPPTPLREAAFFDLDKTVIAKASMVAFGRTLYNEGLISRRTVARGLYAQLIYMHLGASEEKLARMRESVLTLTRGWEKARIEEIVRETLEAVVEPIIYAEALDLLDEHRRAGRRVYIVSASPEEIVVPLAEHLGADEAIASRAQVDEEGRYTGEMEVYAYGPFKAEVMRQVADDRGIDLSASYAYSDSATDIPMLEAVGHPVAVNPDRELLRVARERNWEIRHFVRPVRLRDRVPVPPAAPTAAGALAVGAVLGGALWWRFRQRTGSAAPVPSPAPASGVVATLLSARRRLDQAGLGLSLPSASGRR